jgi:predicted HicB family RNase H-like nuclease
MQYKGYVAYITIDEESGLLLAETIGMKDGVTAQAETIPALQKEFEASIDDYLAWCDETGEQPEKPYSGKFQLRISPQIHRNLAIAAKKTGKSINAFVSEAALKEAERVLHSFT